MNLLIEQRRSSIPSSSKSQTPSSSPLSDQNDMNNSSSAASSSLVLKIKRQTAREQRQGSDSSSASSRMAEDDGEQEEDTADTSNHSRSSSQMQRSKRPNSTSTARRPSSPAFNGKQASKRSVTIDNNNNDLPSHLDESSRTKRFKSNDSTQSSSSKVDASVETVSVGLATEPDHLGPCEPGTSVVLEGIVWNETDSGVLVVNVTWRGKTYVGTLLDSTKQDWACPRLTCESPTSDYDPRSSNKTSRSKRGNAGGNSRSSNHQASASSFQQITSIILASGSDDRKLRHNIKSRQSKRLNQLPSTTTDETTSSPSPLTSPYRTNQTFFPPETATGSTTTSNGEPSLLPCTEANCHKRFASSIALGYHVSDAHQKSELPSSTNVSQASTRDEEDVAHILANVAHYARRSSPPSSMRSSPERAQQEMPSPSLVHSPPLPPARTSLATSNASTLTWPCPQITSKLVQPAALNNDERTASPNSASCPNPHPGIYSASNLLESQSTAEDSTKKDRNNNKKRSKLSSPPPASSFVPISLLPAIPPTASSPAYSDISDEDPTTSMINSHEQILPPSTINLLAASNGTLDENGNQVPPTSFLSSNGGLTHADISNPAWTAQMLFQQFGPYLSQPALVPTPPPMTTAMVSSNHKETSKNSCSTTPNGLNSKTHCSAPNDSTVKNILDARRSSTIKSSSSSTSPPINLYHFHPNGGVNETKFSPSIINTLTSPNENLLHPSTSIASTSTTPSATNTTLKPLDILSLTPSHSTSNGQYPHSSSLHPSR